MAKGFTVKAAAPKKKEADYDIDAIKARMKGKTIVFCLPGRGCSFTFLKNFVQLCFDMVQNGMSIQISQDYSSMVNFARVQMFFVVLSKYLGMENFHMIINCGLIVTLCLTQKSSGNCAI